MIRHDSGPFRFASRIEPLRGKDEFEPLAKRSGAVAGMNDEQDSGTGKLQEPQARMVFRRSPAGMSKCPSDPAIGKEDMSHFGFSRERIRRPTTVCAETWRQGCVAAFEGSGNLLQAFQTDGIDMPMHFRDGEFKQSAWRKPCLERKTDRKYVARLSELI